MRRALQALKLSDAEIAERAGVSERTVRRWRQTDNFSRRGKLGLADLCEEQGERLKTWAEALREEV